MIKDQIKVTLMEVIMKLVNDHVQHVILVPEALESGEGRNLIINRIN